MRLYLLAILVVVNFTLSAEEISLVTFNIPEMVESEQKGAFIALSNAIAKTQNLNIRITVLPPKRAIQDFVDGKFDGLFPALDVNFQSPVNKSYAYYQKTDFAFFDSSSPAITTLSDLHGLNVGITRGYPYVSDITQNDKMILHVGLSDVSNMKKLALGRIDAFIVEQQSGLQALQQSGVEGITYMPEKPLSVQDVYYAFQPTNHGKSLAYAFNQALQKLSQQDKLHAIHPQIQVTPVN